MEFPQKLQELRKQSGWTQDELAKRLYVSRTAVSKWESGRGYPNIDSLKMIAAYFRVTVDDLLTGDELLTIAQQDTARNESRLRDLVFGLLDLSLGAVLFLPFFGQGAGEAVQAVSLLALQSVSLWLKVSYVVSVLFMVAWGVLTLALQNCRNRHWVRNKSTVTLCLNVVSALLFVVGRQPYAAVFMFMFLMVKVLLLIRRR